MNSMIPMLPPILASFGGLVGFLLASNPIKYPKNILMMLSVFYVIIVWIAYVMTRLIGEALFFNSLFTVAALILSVVFLYLVIRGYLTSSEDSEEIRKANRDPRLMTKYYLVAIFFCSVGFTNYLLTTDNVLIKVNDYNSVERLLLHHKDGSFNKLIVHTNVLGTTARVVKKSNFEQYERIEIIKIDSTKVNAVLKDYPFSNWGMSKSYEIN